MLFTSGKLNLDINALITRHYTQRSVARYQLHRDISTLPGRHTKVTIGYSKQETNVSKASKSKQRFPYVHLRTPRRSPKCLARSVATPLHPAKSRAWNSLVRTTKRSKMQCIIASTNPSCSDRGTYSHFVGQQPFLSRFPRRSVM